MSFDHILFGQKMGEAIIRAIKPLQAEIAELKQQLADQQDVREMVAELVQEAVSGLPLPEPGKDGKDCDMEAVKGMLAEMVKAIPTIKGEDGKDGADGKDGRDGKDGERGADGAGVADLLIDRDGVLVATFTDGRMKTLGEVVGKDGRDGAAGRDGEDGLSLESFEMEYLPDSHEVRLKATAAGRVQEVVYPAGGIHARGYWRDGTKAQAGDAWTHDGCLWVARSATSEKPSAQSDSWFLAARRGRDGERGQKGRDGAPPAPIKVKE